MYRFRSTFIDGHALLLGPFFKRGLHASWKVDFFYFPGHLYVSTRVTVEEMKAEFILKRAANALKKTNDPFLV